MRAPPVIGGPAAVAGILVVVLAACARSTAEGPQPEPSSGGGEPTSSVVTADDIRQNPSQSLAQVISSKCAPCAVMISADGRVSIRIRGRGSILGSSEPLYVIDGVPIEPGPGGALHGINPHDIETIEVLTDPTSITMFGARGANGVIVFTTKEPPPHR